LFFPENNNQTTFTHYDLQRHEAAPAAEAAPDNAASGAGAHGAVSSPGALDGQPLPKTLEQRSAPEDGINHDRNQKLRNHNEFALRSASQVRFGRAM
jgi:hypothetical protein